MAEFCLACFNKIEEVPYDATDVKLSRLPVLCEGCGEMRRVVVGLTESAWHKSARTRANRKFFGKQP